MTAATLLKIFFQYQTKKGYDSCYTTEMKISLCVLIAIWFPEPTCILVSTKTRSSGIKLWNNQSPDNAEFGHFVLFSIVQRTKNYNTSVQPLFCSLDPLFGDVLVANNTQRVAACRNRAAKRTQHVAPNNYAICCVGLLRSFGGGFRLRS